MWLGRDSARRGAPQRNDRSCGWLVAVACAGQGSGRIAARRRLAGRDCCVPGTGAASGTARILRTETSTRARGTQEPGRRQPRAPLWLATSFGWFPTRWASTAPWSQCSRFCLRAESPCDAASRNCDRQIAPPGEDESHATRIHRVPRETRRWRDVLRSVASHPARHYLVPRNTRQRWNGRLCEQDKATIATGHLCTVPVARVRQRRVHEARAVIQQFLLQALPAGSRLGRHAASDGGNTAHSPWLPRRR